MVRVLKPNNLLVAYEQARLHELTVNAIVKKSRMGFKSTTSFAFEFIKVLWVMTSRT